MSEVLQIPFSAGEFVAFPFAAHPARLGWGLRCHVPDLLVGVSGALAACAGTEAGVSGENTVCKVTLPSVCPPLISLTKHRPAGLCLGRCTQLPRRALVAEPGRALRVPNPAWSGEVAPRLLPADRKVTEHRENRGAQRGARGQGQPAPLTGGLCGTGIVFSHRRSSACRVLAYPCVRRPETSSRPFPGSLLPAHLGVGWRLIDRRG